MSDFVTRMKLVGPDGETRTFPNDFKGVKLPKGVTVDDAMNALRVHLGVFGVVVEITLKVEPMVSSEVRNYYPQVGQLFYGPNPEIKKIVKENWSVQILWFPFNSLGLIAGLIQGLPLTNIWQPRTDEVWMHTVNIVDTYAETNRCAKNALPKFVRMFCTAIYSDIAPKIIIRATCLLNSSTSLTSLQSVYIVQEEEESINQGLQILKPQTISILGNS